jgi:hypothetical protein
MRAVSGLLVEQQHAICSTLVVVLFSLADGFDGWLLTS